MELTRSDARSTQHPRDLMAGLLQVLNIHRARDRKAAARMVKEGAIIGASFGTVYGIIGDGESPDLGQRVAQIKGERRIGRPLSTCLPARRFSQLLDPGEIHPALRGLALDGHALSRTLSSLAFVRAPIHRSVVHDVPADLVSRTDDVPYIQSVDPGGLPGIRSLMASLWRQGVRFPAITSMNRSGDREIIARDAAFEFSRAHQLAALVVPKSLAQRAQGSFTILEINLAGVRAARHGVIPIAVLQRLMDPAIDDSITERADYPPLEIPLSRLDSLNHYAASRAVLLTLNTALPPWAIRTIARLGLSHPLPVALG
jgi:tRNA A37 threonylcarbamoyladenosine synthetase subunit TsaC/SUA5/YrdC